MDLMSLTVDERIAYIVKSILYQLQNAGGQLAKKEIKKRICNNDDDIANFESTVSVSKDTGKPYKKFNYTFNWAIKDLSFHDYIEYIPYNPIITLTEKGMKQSLDDIDVLKDIVKASKPFWNELKKQNSKNRVSQNDDDDDISEVETDVQEKYDDKFKTELLDAISNMTPKKFEMFSRSLLSEMGVDFTEKGIQMTNDGGLDGFGFHRDSDDFRTSKVVIQCKRFNTNSVQSPDIDKFLGVVSKNQADYGIFITNSYFTRGARETAVLGKPITLIDGDLLVDLVKRYKLHIKEVTTYELDDFYSQEED